MCARICERVGMQCHDFICQCCDKQDGWVRKYERSFALSLPLAHRWAFRKTAVTYEALTERALAHTSALIHDRFIHRLFEWSGSCLMRHISAQNIKEAKATSVEEKRKPVWGTWFTLQIAHTERSSPLWFSFLLKLHRHTDRRARTRKHARTCGEILSFLTGCD